MARRALVGVRSPGGPRSLLRVPRSHGSNRIPRKPIPAPHERQPAISRAQHRRAQGGAPAADRVSSDEAGFRQTTSCPAARRSANDSAACVARCGWSNVDTIRDMEANPPTRAKICCSSLALARFDGRPLFGQLPMELRRDIKSLFSTYRSACEQADVALLAVAT